MQFFRRETTPNDSETQQGSGGFLATVWRKISPFSNALEDESTTLQFAHFSERDGKLLAKDVAGQKDEVSIIGAENDVAEQAAERGKIEALLRLVAAKPDNYKKIIDKLNNIDLVYAEPKEIGVIVNNLMRCGGMDEKARGAAVKATASLLVDIRAADNRVVNEFLDQIDENFMLLLGAYVARTRNLDLTPRQLPKVDQQYESEQRRKVREASEVKNDIKYNSHFLGGNLCAYKGSAPAQDIPAVLPESGRLVDSQPIYLVSGINMTLRDHAEDLQLVANTFERPLIGVHNATRGLGMDFIQARKDAHNDRSNPTINTVRDLVLGAVYRGAGLSLVLVSHGANIGSRGIQRAIHILRGKGWSEEALDEALAKINVRTFAGACWEYPDGPSYQHCMLMKDRGPLRFGLMKLGLSETEFKEVSEYHRKAAQETQFATIEKMAALVAAKVSNPTLHAGRGAQVVILDRNEPLERDENPHSMESHVSRYKRLIERGDRAFAANGASALA